MRTIRDAIDAHAAAAAATRRSCSRPSRRSTVTYGDARAACARGLAAELRGAWHRAPATSSRSCCRNGVAAAGVFLGAMYGGYVVSPVNLLAQDAQIEYTLAHSGARIVFAAPEFVAAAARRSRRSSAAARSSGRRSPDDLGVASARRPRSAHRRSQPRLAGAADVHVGHDRHAEGRAAVARQHAARRRARSRDAHALTRARPRAVVAAALSHQRPVHRDDRAARVGRQHRDAAPLQRVAMVATGRALSADVAQRGADDHRLPAQRRRSDAGAGARRVAAMRFAARRRRRCRPSSSARSRRASASR